MNIKLIFCSQVTKEQIEEYFSKYEIFQEKDHYYIIISNDEYEGIKLKISHINNLIYGYYNNYTGKTAKVFGYIFLIISVILFCLAPTKIEIFDGWYHFKSEIVMNIPKMCFALYSSIISSIFLILGYIRSWICQIKEKNNIYDDEFNFISH